MDVRVLRLSHWLQYKRLLLVVAGVVVLIVATAIAAPRFQTDHEINKIEAVNGAAADKAQGSDDYPRDIKTESLPAGAGSGDRQAGQTDATLPMNDAAGSAEQCTALVQPMVEAYTKDIAKHKSDLDSRITYPIVGSGLIRTYLDEYNQKAAEAHSRYSQIAAASGCSFPAKAPQPLPADYLPDGF